jgi:hypothetical protein
MDGRARGEELLDTTEYRREHARGRSSVERDICPLLTVDASNERPVTDQHNGKPGHDPSCPPTPTPLNPSPRRRLGRR